MSEESNKSAEFIGNLISKAVINMAEISAKDRRFITKEMNQERQETRKELEKFYTKLDTERNRIDSKLESERVRIDKKTGDHEIQITSLETSTKIQFGILRALGYLVAGEVFAVAGILLIKAIGG